MTDVSPSNFDGSIPECDSQQKSSEEALYHLDEVIEHVISEAVEYADKPPEERTLPALVRKSVILARTRQAMAMKNLERMNAARDNGSHRIGPGQMSGQGLSQFCNGIRSDNRVPFGTAPNVSVLQQPQQQAMAQYNGIQPGQYHLHQQYAQAAHQLHLQQQQQQQQQHNHSKYAGNPATAFTHAQLQQQVQAAQQQQQSSSLIGHTLMYPTTTGHGTSNSFSAVSPLGSVPNIPSLPHNHQQAQTVQQHQAAIVAQQQVLAAAAAQQQLNQITAAYAAAHQLPGMMPPFSEQQHAAAQQRWSNAAAYQVAAQQHQQLDPATILRQQQQQQQQYLHQHQQQSQQQAAAAATAAAVSDQLARYAAYHQQQFVKKMQE